MKAVAGRLFVFVCVLAVSVGLQAADPAFIGKWKFNQAKSQMTGDTVTIGPAANGMMQFASQGFSYTFKVDGKPYPTPDGGTTAWKETSPTVWDVVNHLNGRQSSTYHLVLTGDNLAVSGKMMKPEGGSMDFTAKYKRVSGGPGFAGKWMSTEVQMPMTSMEIAISGANGVKITNDGSPLINCQFDGKDTAALGIMAGSKTTFACTKVSDSSFKILAKLDGKPMYEDIYTVSADGKTLTDTGTPLNARTEAYKMVFDRQ